MTPGKYENIFHHMQHILFLLVLLFCTGCGGAVPGNVESPDTVVRHYIENDLKGYRLSSRTWRQKMYPFYYDRETDEPGWDTITVVKGYEVVNTAVAGNDATVAVHYDILCDIGTQVSVRSKTNARVVYSLRMRNGAWKLNGYKTCPLVSQDTAIEHVAGLCKKSENNTAAKKRNLKLLRDLQQLIKETKEKDEK